MVDMPTFCSILHAKECLMLVSFYEPLDPKKDKMNVIAAHSS